MRGQGSEKGLRFVWTWGLLKVWGFRDAWWAVPTLQIRVWRERNLQGGWDVRRLGWAARGEGAAIPCAGEIIACGRAESRIGKGS